MRYLVTGSGEPFYTEWFSVENTYSPGMIVYDLAKDLYFDGEQWKEIEFDHLQELIIIDIN